MMLAEKYIEEIMAIVCDGCHYLYESEDEDKLIDEICTECPYEPKVKALVEREMREKEENGEFLLAPDKDNEWRRVWKTEIYFGSEAERDEFDRKLMEGWAPLEWISTKAEVPAGDEMVLCVVTGKHGNIDFRNAIQLGNWYKGEGWVLDTYPEIENPNVTHWMELPEGPGEE